MTQRRRQASIRTRSILAAALVAALPSALAEPLKLNEQEYFSRPGLDVLVFNNYYDGLFSDAKHAGVELIHHGVRTATNGDVRLSPTPEQWDPVALMLDRKVDARTGTVTTRMGYPNEKFEYSIQVSPQGDGVRIQVLLDKPLPKSLQGRAGFNLEFLPSAYFGKSWAASAAQGERHGQFPLYPAGPTSRGADGKPVRMPITSGQRLVLAPEDPQRRVTISSNSGELGLYDGRNQAQNGWFVVRTLLPAGKRGAVLDWTVEGHTLPGWTREPVIGHSQVGYHPAQRKVAVLETDPRSPAPGAARLLRIGADGSETEALSATPAQWGRYLRYQYYTFDFSSVREPGLYQIEAAGQRTHAFRIAEDVYAEAWHPTADVFFPVQMDHMFVNEAYRVWHGRPHMDDARQVAPNHEHFDLFAQGPELDSPFQPGEHIPGLNYGGWFDAGDFDIRTQTHYATVLSMVDTWERFRPLRDETTIDQQRKHVEIHVPDGKPDLVQQIEHGTLALIAQHRVFGHAIPGIVEPDLGQYTHLGDASTKTDGKVDDPNDPDSPRDDRLAFTSNTTALNYGSAAALAAASRALRGHNDALAHECLETARKVWEFEQSREPNLFRVGNTTGGHPDDEQLRAAAQLLVTTGDARYAEAIRALWPKVEERFGFNIPALMAALPKMDDAFRAQVRARAERLRQEMAPMTGENPYGVVITRGGWAGNGAVVGMAIANYHLHKAFPDLFDAEPTLQGLNYLYGTHPDSNLSFVSAVGARSKQVAYGNNRADFSYIAGGVVPGVLVLKPDFPENKEDWPFFWGQNEYVIDLAAHYMFLVHAAQDVLKPGDGKQGGQP
ncbi:glycoside hydrolase family 9 [Pseudoxanthomonas suwonensis 11-1]|uniref:Glycoside hydrolase family 9 n=1 Tax=Pseudoxanthomonas suwonensis (strain 11-1) TaxID=743721 RepID=E6WW26_PSEUU|nr:glycoside hydrolase family 9 protein [Pseudoxanthomonas suwonensis]ADV28517.1 glycoside hydrolase family 9 [Pseudoxanthomonas suwonensis 11-1]